MESAGLTMTELPDGVEAWVRIYLEARQDGSAPERVALFTGLLSAPGRDADGLYSSYKAECYSALKPSADVLLAPGWYAPAGAFAAQLAAELLSVGPAPVSVPDADPILAEYIVAEARETHLSMAHKLLQTIGWRLRIDGRGEIHIEPPPTAPAAVFGEESDVIEPRFSDERDLFSCPNCLLAASGSDTAEARDDSPMSSLSTVSRGREVWAQESNVVLSGTESLSDYARRRLRELQAPARTVKYTRRYHPDVRVGDLVEFRYPGAGLSGIFRVKSQTLSLGHNCATEEEAVQV